MKIIAYSSLNSKSNNTFKANKIKHNPHLKEHQWDIRKKNATEVLTLSAFVITGINIALTIKHNQTKIFSKSKSILNKIKNKSEQALKNTTSEHLNQHCSDNLTKILNETLTENNKIEQLAAISTPKLEILTKLEDELVKKNKEINISSYKLDYDPMNPPVNILKDKKKYDYTISGPYTPPSTRSEMEELIIPEFTQKNKVDFQIPIKTKIQVQEAKTINFTPIQNRETNISESYAESVNWNNDKIARDILQNFYDGHGQTLDGVRFEIEPEKKLFKTSYKVKISGLGQYSPDKALLIGESTKRNDVNAAGNYGEGLKMSILKILKDSKVNEIKIGSENWNVTYQLQKSLLNNKKVLSYNLDKVEKTNGNYFEFETENSELVNSFRRAINYFYHSSNTDFKCPDFENSFFGIKKLDKNEKGSIYIAGQRFEFKNNWQGLDGMTLFFKEKPPKEVLDISRDRLSIMENDLPKLLEYYTFKSSNPDKIKALHSLQDLWDKEGVTKKIINGITNAINNNFIHVNFPDNYLSKGYSIVSFDLIQNLKSSGYKICDLNFSAIGMNDVSNFLKATRNHTPLEPTPDEIKKIGIIKKAIAQFPDLYKSGTFKTIELDPKIYIFEAGSANETKLTKNWEAEAIVDYKTNTTKGFWIDKKYLNKAPFADIISTTLHELTHKKGGDGDSAFSYALTDVLGYVINSTLTNDSTVNELRKLNLEWILINK